MAITIKYPAFNPSGWRSCMSSFPFELEFNFFLPAFALMLNIEICPRRYIYSLAGDLDFKLFATFQTVRQPSQFGGHLFDGIAFFDVPVFLPDHFILPVYNFWRSSAMFILPF
jgi:hypothetical protein